MNNFIRYLKGFFQTVILLTWFLFSFYFGFAGYSRLKIDELIELAKKDQTGTATTVNNINFKNIYYLQAYQEEMKCRKFFTAYYDGLPDKMILMLTACSFGILGAVGSLIKNISIDNQQITDVKTISTPLLGAFAGMVMLGIAALIPTLLVAGESEVSPIGIVFLSFFAGLFIKYFYGWVENIASKIFPVKTA